MHPAAFVEVEAVPEIALLSLAILTIIILGELWLMEYVFSRTFARIPVVGGPLARYFTAGIRWARGVLLATLHGTLWAAGKIFRATAAFMRNMVQDARDTLSVLDGAMTHTVDVIIPREIGAVRGFALRQANNALVTALEYARSVRQDAQAWYRQGLAYTDVQVKSATQTVLGILTSVTATLSARITAARADARAWVDAATARADRQFRQAEADAAVLAKQAEQAAIKIEQAAVDGQARDAWAPIWAGIMTGVAGAISVAGSDFPAITRQLQAIATQAPATLAQAETAAASAIPPMMTALEECVLPGCRDLGPLRTLMSQLADALFAALLLAWVVQMITDPQGWAQETYDAFGPLIDGELAVVRALAGI